MEKTPTGRAVGSLGHLGNPTNGSGGRRRLDICILTLPCRRRLRRRRPRLDNTSMRARPIKSREEV